MPRIARHPVNTEELRKDVLLLGEDLSKAVTAARKDLVHCNALKMDALDYAAQVLVLSPESLEACRPLRIGAQAMVAVFDGALAVGEEVEVRIGDGPLALAPSAVDKSLHHVGNWTDGFSAAAICRERDLMDALCRVPVEVLRRSSTRGLEHTYLLAAALQAYWRKEGEARERAVTALQATEDEKLPGPALNATRELAVPKIEVFLRLVEGRPEPFNEALYRALQLHHHYWSREVVANDPVGYIGLYLTGLAALAHDAGIPVTVESDYLPMGLVRGGCRPAAQLLAG